MFLLGDNSVGDPQAVRVAGRRARFRYKQNGKEV
jgi:hypothetical protein